MKDSARLVRMMRSKELEPRKPKQPQRDIPKPKRPKRQQPRPWQSGQWGGMY